MWNFFNTRQLSETKKNILLILSKPNVELLIKMCYLLANLIALLEHKILKFKVRMIKFNFSI